MPLDAYGNVVTAAPLSDPSIMNDPMAQAHRQAIQQALLAAWQRNRQMTLPKLPPGLFGTGAPVKLEQGGGTINVSPEQGV